MESDGAAATGPDGLPMGIQVVGPRGEDGATLASAQWVGECLRS